MSKKLLSIEVKGDRRSWGFTFHGDPKYLPEWRADGLEIYEIMNIIPGWMPAWAIRPWCAAQDLFNFKLPWRGRS